MFIRRLLCTLALLASLAWPCRGQEPQPARLGVSSLAQPGGVQLTYAWRYAPGDGPGRESVALDDAHWQRIRPALDAADLPASSWRGIGWFRRHLVVDPMLQGKTIALRVTAPGTANVYLDGNLALTLGPGPAPPAMPGARSDAVLIRLRGPSHLLAVRYVYPRDAPRPAEGVGFVLALTDPAGGAEPQGPSNGVIGLKGAMVALPLFLALFHLALFAFDRRAGENLFYAGEMLMFAIIVLHSYTDTFFTAEGQRNLVDLIDRGVPALAVLFVLLTYYAVRVHPYPRTRRLFIVAGLLLSGWAYVAPDGDHFGWAVYFVAVVVEVTRLEHGKRNIRPEGARPFLGAFAVAGVAITLQMLIDFGFLESVAGLREVYLFGIVASAVGMSLYLARRMERSRTIESENERKTLELSSAREIQLSMLPRALPRMAGLDVAAASHTAAEVGGDYYDVKPAGEGGLLIAIGDATGHGLAAGIVVTAAKALFSSLSADLPVSHLLARCDDAFRAMQLPRLRMCLALARVSPSEVSIASAALPPVLIHRAATGRVEELGSGGLPLGGRLASHAQEQRVALQPGDTLLFSSDGLAELFDPAGSQFGYEAVAESFRTAAQADGAQGVIDQLLATAAAFRAARPLDDDITLVAVRVSGR